MSLPKITCTSSVQIIQFFKPFDDYCNYKKNTHFVRTTFQASDNICEVYMYLTYCPQTQVVYKSYVL